MYKRLVRIASGVFVVIFAAAPMSATAVPKTTLAPAALAATVVSRSRPTSTRPQTGYPSACTSNGPYSFSGYNPTGSDYAGGGAGDLTGYAFVGNGFQNQACDYETFIGNGFENAIFLAQGSGIVNGSENSIQSSGNGFIGSGAGNTIASATDSSIVGGSENEVVGAASFIGGGQDNFATGQYLSVLVGGGENKVSGTYGSMIGGWQNTVSNTYGTIGGGYLNTASGVQATISGGYGNTASGKDATIPGGSTNSARGINSFAAGYESTAGYNGDFVWSDYLYGSAGASATAPDQFVARATGGFYLYSSKSLTGVALAPGSGAWSTLSDRHVKTGIENVDDTRILKKLAAMPISEWSYKAQGMGVRHLGPMAQDFRAAFGLGEDDRHISTIDEEGVALAAIKALQAENAAKDREIAQLRRVQSDADQRLEAKYARLEQRLDALDRAHNSGS